MPSMLTLRVLGRQWWTDPLRWTRSGRAVLSRWSSRVLPGGDGKVGQAPFEQAVVEADGGPAAIGQQPDGVVGEHAVFAAAVHHDVDVLGQLAEAVGQLVHGDVDRTGDVPGQVLLDRA